MFRLNPLKVIRHLSEIGNVYHEVFMDDNTKATADEVELAKKLKGRKHVKHNIIFSWYRVNQAINHRSSSWMHIVFVYWKLFATACAAVSGMIDVFLEPDDLEKLNGNLGKFTDGLLLIWGI